MKKYLKLLFVALFATLSFALVSCGDDDDDDAGSLVGTWESSFVDAEDDWSYYGIWTLTNDGKFNMATTENDGGHIYTEAVAGTYTVNGDVKSGATVYMIGIDEDGDTVDATIIVKVSGDTLYATDEDGDTIVWTRK